MKKQKWLLALLGALVLAALFSCNMENKADGEAIKAERLENFVSPLDLLKIVDHYEAVGATACCYANTDGSSGPLNTYGDHCPPELAIDGLTGTRWSSNYQGGIHTAAWTDNRHWLTVDLGEVRDNITTIKLVFRNSGSNHVTNYQLYISDDDDLADTVIASKLIKTGTNSSMAGVTIPLDTPVSGRYIQLRCNVGTASTEQCIAEFQVPFEPRVEGFTDIDTSYLKTAFIRGQAVLPNLTNPARVKELSALLEKAKPLVLMTPPEGINDKIIFQEQVDSVAKPLITLINSLAI
ncbi:hypothetical protein AGMMS49991_09710 [Spirochaetia bacterium]|nr:hypothetical protein AGMMS49991_09710 [Spirochaetia bacterium]